MNELVFTIATVLIVVVSMVLCVADLAGNFNQKK